MAYLEFGSTGETYINVRIAGLDTNYSRSDRYVEWEVDGSPAGTTTGIPAYASTTPWKQLSGLSPGTLYYIRGDIYYTSGGVWYSTFYDGFESTDSPTPVIPAPSNTWFTNVTTSSITFNWSSVAEATDGYDVYFKENSGDSYQFITNTQNGSWQFNSLSSGTTYYFGVRAVSGSNESSMATDSQSTSSAPVRPSNWNWTTAELSAFNNNGAITTITYTRWNDFVARVNAFRTYKGFSTISASMSSSDKVLTASRFNTVNSAINTMYNTYIGTVSSGDDVLGSYFITLADSLNNIS